MISLQTVSSRGALSSRYKPWRQRHLASLITAGIRLGLTLSMKSYGQFPIMLIWSAGKWTPIGHLWKTHRRSKGGLVVSVQFMLYYLLVFDIFKFNILNDVFALNIHFECKSKKGYVSLAQWLRWLLKLEVSLNMMKNEWKRGCTPSTFYTNEDKCNDCFEWNFKCYTSMTLGL